MVISYKVQSNPDAAYIGGRGPTRSTDPPRFFVYIFTLEFESANGYALKLCRNYLCKLYI